MNKFWIFLGGVAVGGIGTFIYTTKVVVPALRKEIRKQIEDEEKAERMDADISSDAIIVAEHYGHPDELEDGVVVTNNPVKSAGHKTKAPVVDYSHYSKPSENSLTEKKQTDISAKQDTDEFGGGEPYIIDANAYDSYSDYKAKEFEVYSDGVIFDVEADDVLDADPESVFGRTAMEELLDYKKGIDELYIRDDTKNFDYHLKRVDIPFDGPTGEIIPANPDDWRD